MLYCDLFVDNAAIWYSVPCLNLVPLKAREYLKFTGELFFLDAQGYQDPTYDGLGTRYQFIYENPVGSYSMIPLDPVPSQRISVVLGNQSCTLDIYDRVML